MCRCWLWLCVYAVMGQQCSELSKQSPTVVDTTPKNSQVAGRPPVAPKPVPKPRNKNNNLTVAGLAKPSSSQSQSQNLQQIINSGESLAFITFPPPAVGVKGSSPFVVPIQSSLCIAVIARVLHTDRPLQIKYLGCPDPCDPAR